VTVEFVGMIGTRDVSETRAPVGPPIDLACVRRSSRAHEDAGFSVSFRPILAATDDLAWERAERIRATIEASKGGKGSFTGDKTTILIRGYDPVDDAVDYGRHLIPLVKQELARRSLVSA
jgi:alkanesulfonate monooxygenase SsuD/methylene tetrahydromethanopterin reductase-like flavin-dependent oxidoreductase (luciferase family)